MKERYVAAKMDVVLFEVEDIIVTSIVDECPDNTELPDAPFED